VSDGRPSDGGVGLDFTTLARTRRSIRRYRPDPPSEDVLLQVLEAARWAPSAVNSQPWHFVVVRDASRRRALADKARLFRVFRWRHLATAPVVVAIVGDPRGNRWMTVDCALAGANLMLAAHSLGLGTCWIGGFDQDALRPVLGVPPEREIVGLVTLGYPAENPKPPPRIPLERLISWEVFDPSRAAGRLERVTCSCLYSVRKRILAMVRPRRGPGPVA